MFFLSASSQQEFYKTYVHLKGQSASLGPSQQEFYKTYVHLKGKFASSVASLKKPLQSLSGPNGNQEAPNKNFIKPMCTSRRNLPPLAHPNKNGIKPMCTSRGNLPPPSHPSKNPFKAYLAPMAIKSPQDKRVSRGQKKKWASMILLKGPCGLLSMSLVVVKGLEVVEIISCKRITSTTSSPMPFLYNPLTILPRV